WADALRARGISEIRGDLYYYDGALDAQQTHPSWSKSFLVDWYAAPVAGLIFNDNCVDVTIRPTTDGQLVEFDVMPPAKGIKVINHCVTGEKHAPEIDRASDANVYTISGTCSKRAELDSKPV